MRNRRRHSSDAKKSQGAPASPPMPHARIPSPVRRRMCSAAARPDCRLLPELRGPLASLLRTRPPQRATASVRRSLRTSRGNRAEAPRRALRPLSIDTALRPHRYPAKRAGAYPVLTCRGSPQRAPASAPSRRDGSTCSTSRRAGPHRWAWPRSRSFPRQGTPADPIRTRGRSWR